MYYIIVNSQSGKGEKAWNKVKHELMKHNLSYKVKYINKNDDICSLPQDLKKLKIKALIIVGGDGTIHHTLKYLEHISVPIGIIPAGSGNDFSRALKIPKNSVKAFQTILRNKTKQIDMININGKFAASIVGVGFDAVVAQFVNNSSLKGILNKWKLGSLSYIIGLFKSICSFRSSDIEITIDGKLETFPHTLLIATANTTSYGGGLKICPKADETDGIFNICIVHSLSKIQLLLFFPLVFLGLHTLHPKVEMRTGKFITIKSKDDIMVQADGEFIGYTPVTIENVPKKIQVFI